MLDGKKVKLGVEKLLKTRGNSGFRDFVKENEDKVFTAHLAWGYTTLYTLDEDPSLIKWLFSESDLIEVKD